jgi:predicted  nucleic acid-binding Zn-ribbon protein
MNALQFRSLQVQASQLYDNIQDTKQTINAAQQTFASLIAGLESRQEQDETQLRALQRKINEEHARAVLGKLATVSM